jgi:hypothetical protein
MHVSFGCCKSVKRGIATLAFEFQAPVVVFVHVIVGGILCPVQVITGFALPVAYSIHVLLGGMPVTKRPVACPVAAVKHFDDETATVGERETGSVGKQGKYTIETGRTELLISNCGEQGTTH